MNWRSLTRMVVRDQSNIFDASGSREEITHSEV